MAVPPLQQEHLRSTGFAFGLPRQPQTLLLRSLHLGGRETILQSHFTCSNGRIMKNTVYRSATKCSMPYRQSCKRFLLYRTIEQNDSNLLLKCFMLNGTIKVTVMREYANKAR